ncbi:DUF2815 family protein [Providencia vermicola]|uniref:DUF2815 family protein n=1 Tax=Providencia vermicola TaxID=333965 RepID=A0AAX3S2Q0_9GAMM|nr:MULTISPECIES: DUF2815 family protein [Providencia]ELR5121647.1 DUF2815 family protein [Providencia stuartii]ELR5141103.1 DUF2815 family protein [Providencia stuartii]ELX8378381.1 DUF2815 family protein [Providencia stuartii]EMD5257588.1 DUF2815 family protein [Providencia stuartii]QIC15477.1 DUF2815 family protein [Providencia vermicola]
MKVKLSNVRLAFPDLFEATQVNGQGDYKFRGTFLIPKNRTDLIEAIESAIKQAATAKWGAKASAILKSIRGNSKRFNFRDGDEKIEYDGYADHMYISASNKVRPLVIDRDRTPLTTQDHRPYSGCYVNATITIFAYDNQGKGISASLGGVQFFRDGDAFAGARVASEDDFDDLSVAEEEESLI